MNIPISGVPFCYSSRYLKSEVIK